MQAHFSITHNKMMNNDPVARRTRKFIYLLAKIFMSQKIERPCAAKSTSSVQQLMLRIKQLAEELCFATATASE